MELIALNLVTLLLMLLLMDKSRLRQATRSGGQALAAFGCPQPCCRAARQRTLAISVSHLKYLFKAAVDCIALRLDKHATAEVSRFRNASANLHHSC